jgi:hypothetical protein
MEKNRFDFGLIVRFALNTILSVLIGHKNLTMREGGRGCSCSFVSLVV